VLPPGCELRLQVTDAASQRIRIFSRWDKGARQLIGPGAPQATLFDLRREMTLAIEALQYPDRSFQGLITVELVLARGDEQLYCDRVVFRVAPWIMPSTLMDAEKVYVCEMENNANADFIAILKDIADQAGAELVKVPPSLHRATSGFRTRSRSATLRRLLTSTCPSSSTRRVTGGSTSSPGGATGPELRIRDSGQR